MRVAAIYDIHGNLPALEAVLGEIEREDVDRIVVGGDLAWGPLPKETMDRLFALRGSAEFVRGNADREVAARMDEADGLDPATARVNVWCHDELDEEKRRFLAEQQETVQVDVDELGAVLFCHGSPRSDVERITEVTPPERVEEMIKDVAAPIIVCGHTHAQFDRRVGEVRIVNPGSVGLPFGESGAYWALFGSDVELRRTDYDLEAAAAAMRAKGGPEAEEFVSHILAPPPAEAAHQF